MCTEKKIAMESYGSSKRISLISEEQENTAATTGDRRCCKEEELIFWNSHSVLVALLSVCIACSLPTAADLVDGINEQMSQRNYIILKP